MKKVFVSGVAAALLLSAFGVGVSPAHAVELRVTSADDSGPGTLREALSEADASPGEDTIVISEGLELYPESEFQVNDAVRIVGEGSGASISLERQEPPSAWMENINMFSPSASLSIENLTLHLTPKSGKATAINGWLGSTVPAISVRNCRFIGDADASGVNADSKTSSIRVVESAFEGVGTPFVILGNPETIEVAQNTITDPRYLLFEYGASGPANQQFRFVDNIVEFDKDAAGVDFMTGASSSEQEEVPAVISGNRFVDRTDRGVFVRLDASNAPSPGNAVPKLLFENNSVERDASSTSTTPLLQVGYAKYGTHGPVKVSSSTIDANPGAPAVVISGRKANNNDYAEFDHVTVGGQIKTYYDGDVTINNSAMDGNGSPAVNADSGAAITGVGNVVVGDSSALAGAKTVDDLLLGDLADIGLGESFARVPLAGSPVLDAGSAPRSVEDQRGVLGTRAGLSDAGSVEAQRALVTVGDAGEVAAGSDARFPVTVVEPGDTSFDVELTTVDGTAVAGAGFTSTTQTVSFAAGETGSKDFSVPTLQASAVDGSEFGMSARVVLGAAELDADSGTALLRVSKEPTGPIVDPTVPDPEEPVGPIVDPTVKPTGQNLARTGSDALVLPWVLGAGLVLMGGAVVLARRKTRNG